MFAPNPKPTHTSSLLWTLRWTLWTLKNKKVMSSCMHDGSSL